MNVDLVGMENAGNEMLNFIDENLTYPNANFSQENKVEFIRILDGFPFKNVNLNETVVYDIEDVDEDYGAQEYDDSYIRKRLAKLHESYNLIHRLVSMLRHAVKGYTDTIHSRVFDGDVVESVHHRDLNILLNNLIAVFNVANAAAGGRKRKSRKSAKKSRKSAKKSARKSHKKSARKSLKKSRKH